MRIIPLLLAVFLLVGCGKPAEKPASVPSERNVIAKVNGEPIYEKDIKLSIALRMKEDPSFRITPATKQEQIERLIDERLSLQHKQRNNSRIEIFTPQKK